MIRRRAVRLGAAASLAAVLAGCAAGTVGMHDAMRASSPPTPATTTVQATAAPGGASTAVVATATAGALPASPPAATLAGLAGDGTALGAVGSYTWGGDGSDGPWVVAPPVRAVPCAAVLAVSFGGAVPESWTAAWARVAGGTAGSPSTAGAGDGLPRPVAPADAGDWSLRVTAVFGPGHSAAYYWHLVVSP